MFNPTTSAHGSKKLAHRYSWEMFIGSIPDGMCVLHRCDNPICVNPSHLFVGSKKDNMQDASKKGRMSKGGYRKACALGHGAMRLRPSGIPYCQTCSRIQARNWYREKHGITTFRKTIDP